MVLVLGKIFLKKLPMSLLVVVAGIVASRRLGLDERGVKLLGEVPQGLPDLGLPAVRWNDLNAMLPLAFACFLLAAVETAAIGRTFAAKYDRRLDANQEFLALGASNLAAGFGQGFPVSGGMSQSVVNEGGGARTPLSGAIAAVFILVVVLFFSQLLSALPQPVLAAVVLVAVASLVSLSALRHLWRSDGREFVIAMVAMFGVLGQGLLRGVAIGAVISLVLLIRRVATARRLARSHPRHTPVFGSRATSGERNDSRHAHLAPGRELALFQHELRARHDRGTSAGGKGNQASRAGSV